MHYAIGRTTVLVEDYDEAREYYTETIGFEVIVDAELDDGFRTLHVGPPDATTGLWLVEPTTDAGRERIGAQTAGHPTFVVYTADVERTYETLRDRGVAFTSEPTEGDSGTHVHFEDLYGTPGLFVELDEDAD